jgi:hypothetical protein
MAQYFGRIYNDRRLNVAIVSVCHNNAEQALYNTLEDIRQRGRVCLLFQRKYHQGDLPS